MMGKPQKLMPTLIVHLPAQIAPLPLVLLDKIYPDKQAP